MYTLHKKSCMGMKEVATDSIDGIVTSPPYKDEDGYTEELMKDLARNCYRVLKNGSSCFVNFGSAPCFINSCKHSMYTLWL